jgi:PAS domain S-box-containing protein
LTVAALDPPEFQELEAFEQANAPPGLLRRYARGRVRALWFRLSMILIGVAIGGIFVGLPLAVAMFMTMVLAELAENRLLLGVLRHPPTMQDFTRRSRQVAFASFIQALGIGGSIAALGVQGEALRFAAWVFLLGATLNSLVGARYHVPSHKARIAVYIGTSAAILGHHIAVDAVENSTAAIEVFCLLLFFYMMSRLFQHFFRREEKMVESERRLLRQKLEKSAINAELAQSRLALARREKEARRLALVAEHATDSVILSDTFSTILWVNSQFTRITGYSLEEVVGYPVGQILNGPDTCEKTLSRIKAACGDKKPFKDHILNYRKDGSTVWMEISITPVFDKQGQFQMFISVERDATENMEKQHQLEMALVAAKQADTAKSEFLSRMSHELRTPVNAIVGGVDLLAETKLCPDQRAVCRILRQGSDRMSYVVESILGYCELTKGTFTLRKETVDIADLLRKTVDDWHAAAKAKGITGPVLHLPVGVDLVVCSDPFLLKNMFGSLIDNAVKFTAQGGVHVIVKARRRSGMLALMLEVRDTGIGISAENQKHIFKQFTQVEGDFSRKFDGAGLGLSLAATCAHKLSGTIEVASVEEQGSCFTVSLELEAVTGPHVPGTEYSDENPVKKMLVAEDNRTNRMLIGRYFKDLPMHVEFAEDGVQAVKKYAEMKPDVVLMDISMPNKDGLQATKEIRLLEKEQQIPACPILALTANTFESDRKNCFEAGMDAFLAKPVRKKPLIEAINNAIGAGPNESRP